VDIRLRTRAPDTTLNASSPTRAVTDDELDTYLDRAGPITGH
jgi:hypothetical protein